MNKDGHLKTFKRKLCQLDKINSNHNGISKSVYFTSEECISSITQIAYSFLKKNEKVEQHSHPTMEEVFLVLEGECSFNIDGNELNLSSFDVVKVPPGSLHSIYATKDCKFYYFGVAI
jgi:quercetin dioxygenase-like cupin family protein